MALLGVPVTPSEEQELKEAARLALVCYESAIADPKVVIPTPLHAAFLRLKHLMELLG